MKSLVILSIICLFTNSVFAYEKMLCWLQSAPSICNPQKDTCPGVIKILEGQIVFPQSSNKAYQVSQKFSFTDQDEYKVFANYHISSGIFEMWLSDDDGETMNFWTSAKTTFIRAKGKKTKFGQNPSMFCRVE